MMDDVVLRVVPYQGNFEVDGIGLRDVFAAFALTGMLTHRVVFDNPSKAAEWAYRQADAMLAARQT